MTDNKFQIVGGGIIYSSEFSLSDPLDDFGCGAPSPYLRFWDPPANDLNRDIMFRPIAIVCIMENHDVTIRLTCALLKP